MILTPDGAGGFTATGSKYYIGNGNVAGMVSVFGRRADVEGPEGYVFFAVDSQHPAYRLESNVVASQMFVSAFSLVDYPVTAADVLHTGPGAFDAALNTVNIGKFNLGFASIGICEHSFHEAITHADARVLYGKRVTDFPHVRQAMTDAYCRLVAMKLFGDRAVDYFRTASAEDRRYLLFNPVTKMKVTTEGERCIDGMWDVVAAKGFERDTYFEQASMHIRALPKLEGTVHVNMALVLKFLPNYLFGSADLPEVPQVKGLADDAFLFHQGPARGLSTIAFPDWRAPYDAFAHVPNVAVFREQAEGLVGLVSTSAPDAEQVKDLDLLLTLGELFTLVVYGQLVLEQAGADRARRGDGGPGLRRPGPRLLRLRRRPARQGVVEQGSAAVGAGPRAQAGHRRRPLRAGLGRGALLRRPVRDEPLTLRRTRALPPRRGRARGVPGLRRGRARPRASGSPAPRRRR